MSETLKVVMPIVVVHAVVLGIIIFAIKKLLLHNTMQAVNTVKQVETEVRKKESGIMRQIEEHEKEFVKKKNEAEEAMERQRKESESEITQMRDRLLGDAKKEGQQIIDRAKQNEEKLRQQIAQDMEEKAVDYGGEVFQLVFSEIMTAELNKHFINELLDALEEVDAASITVDEEGAEFKSSHPLAADQKERLKKLLFEKFGAEVDVNEVVQKELMGGLVFKLGSLEIDGSLVNRYREAIAEVKKAAHV